MHTRPLTRTPAHLPPLCPHVLATLLQAQQGGRALRGLASGGIEGVRALLEARATRCAARLWCTTGGAGPARTHTPTRPPRGSWVLPHTAEELAAVGIGSLLEAVELLLRFHPDDVDGPHGPAGCSLLQHAVRHGLLLLARRLLLRGADPSLAVHLAADSGQVAMVRLLLQWGAPLDALDERGVTMLSKARGRGAAESGREVASLLESSAKAVQELREASRAVVSILPKQARSAHRLAW